MTTNEPQFSGEAVECDTTTTTESKPFVNKFINDGSFLETFKKMQQEQQQQQKLLLNQPSKKQEPLETINQSQSTSDKHVNINQEINSPSNSTTKVASNDDQTNQQHTKDNQIKLSHNNKIMVGKRRNQKLKVGIIKRSRKESDSDNEDLDAWAKYMKEVRQYKEKYGDDSDKKRPLVK